MFEVFRFKKVGVSWRTRLVLLLSCVLFSSHSAGSSGGSGRELLEDIELDRIPINRRGVLDISNRLILPPLVKEQGVTFRIGGNIEYGDNIFFRDNESEIESDTLFSITPGVHFLHKDNLNQTDLDLTFEAVEYGSNSELSDTISNASFLAVGSYRISHKTSLEFIEQYSLTSDLSTQVIPGLVTELDQIEANYIEFGAAHQYTNTDKLTAAIASDIANYDDDSLVDTTTFDLNLGWNTKKSKSIYGAEYRARLFDFRPRAPRLPEDVDVDFDPEDPQFAGSDGGSELTHAVYLTQEKLLTPLWLWEGKIGALFSEDVVTDGDIIGEAKLRYREYDEWLTFSFSRDYIIGGGFEAVYLSQAISAEYFKQVEANTSFTVSSSFNKLVPRNFDQGELRVIKGEASVNYFVDKKTLLRVNIETLRQETPGFSNTTKANTLTFSIVYSI